MLRVLSLAAAAAVLMSLGLSGPTQAQTGGTAPDCPSGLAPGSHFVGVTSGGLARQASLHLPPAASAGQPLALVVALHGAGGSGSAMARTTDLSTYADREGFAVVYPRAWGDRPFWNMNGHVAGKPDDVAFIRDLLDRLDQVMCVDHTRVFATGVSNGGGMAARLGCELSDRFAAIAPVAGGYGSLPACHPDHPVSVLEIHGTGDVTVPYYGKSDGSGKVLSWLAMWRRLDGCAGRATRSTGHGGLVRLAWTACRDGTVISHDRLPGIPHGWPSRHVTDQLVSATAEVTRFFAAHPRTSP